MSDSKMWIVLHSGLALEVPRLDGQGKPVLDRFKREVKTQKVFITGEPYEFDSKTANRLCENGHARRARAADFEEGVIPGVEDVTPAKTKAKS